MFPSFAMDVEPLVKGPRMDHKLEELPHLSIPELQHDLSLFPGPLSSDLSEATPSPLKQELDSENSPTRTSYSSVKYSLEQDATGLGTSLSSTEPRTVTQISQEASPEPSEAAKENWTDILSWFHHSQPNSSNAEGTGSQCIHQDQPCKTSQVASNGEVVDMIQNAFANDSRWKEESEQVITNTSLVQTPAIPPSSYNVSNQEANLVRHEQSLIADQAIDRPEFSSEGLGIYTKAASAIRIDGTQDEAAGCQNLPVSRWQSILPGHQPLHLDFHGAWRTPNGYAPVHTRLQLPNNGCDFATQQQREQYPQRYEGFTRLPGGSLDRQCEGFQFSMAELAQLHLQNARNRSISKMPLTKLYAMMGLENDPVKAKWREECILDIVRNEGFDVGNQTWIRDTEDSTRKRIIGSIYRQTREFGYTCELLEIIVRRGTYARMQSKLRQRRRHNKRTMALRQIQH